MRKTIISLVIVASFQSQATVRTVSNFPSNLAQFNDIQSAINASTNGDTILVHGSPYDYGTFNCTIKITLIGPGFSPDKAQLPFTARVNGHNFFQPTSAFSEVQGMVFTGTVYTYSKNMRFIRNEFNVGAGGGIYNPVAGALNTLIEGNYFNGGGVFYDGGIFSNVIIRNNVFRNGSLDGFLNSANVLIDHNLFYSASATPYTVFYPIAAYTIGNRFLTISNNIFVNANASIVINSSFNNNITFNCGNNAPWSVNDNFNTASSNIENQDPLMVAQTAVNAGTNNALLDFSIPTGVANDAGSDGKDLGVLYDTNTSRNWALGRLSRLPYIYSLGILNPTSATSGGTITIQLNARKAK